MIKSFGTLLIALICIQTVAAQSVERHLISFTGTFINADGSIGSSTAGEPVAGPISNGSTLLTQGFQQPIEEHTISKHQGDFSLNLNPNPAQSFVLLSFKSTEEIVLQIELLDVLGRQVAGSSQETKTSEEVSLDLSSLPSGLYMVRVSFKGDSKPIIIKFIKSDNS